MRTLLLIVCTFCLGILAGYFFFFEKDDAAPQASIQETVPTVVITENVLETEEQKDLLVGAWRSVDDSRFTRVFSDEGTVVDEYEGMPEARSDGTWRRFSTQDPEEVPFTLMPQIEYVRIAFAEEMLYFTVTEVTPSRLELVYLGTGETLQFERVQ